MTNFLIHAWHRHDALATSPLALTREVLVERLRPFTDLATPALVRLVLRLQARYPISLPLRADADATALVAWFTQAGAVVSVSTTNSTNPTPAPPSPSEILPSVLNS